MKFSAASLSCSFAAMALTAMTLVEARLYHLPLGRVNNDNHFRHLATGDADADQDNLYQARGVQYADLKVGKFISFAIRLSCRLLSPKFSAFI